MPSFVVKCPNGKLALFSTIVDDFIIVEVAVDELVKELCEDKGRKDAIAKVQRGVLDEPLIGGPHVEFAAPTFKRWHLHCRA